MPETAWHITTSQRFARDQRRANPQIGRLIDQEVIHLARRTQHRPKEFMRDYTLRKGTVVDVPIIELEVGSGFRILAAHFEGRELCLLMCGQHDNVYAQWNRDQKGILNRAQRERLPYKATSPPHGPLSDLAREPGPGDLTYRWPEELTDEWLFLLDDAQTTLFETILDSVHTSMLTDQRGSHVILGGPGTGKTAILLKLMDELAGRDGQRIGFRCTPQLAVYLADKTGLPIDLWRSEPNPEVLVVDDPASLTIAHDYTQGPAPCQVIAFDPLQLDVIPTDAQLQVLFRHSGMNVHYIKQCYRQKEEPGRQALAVSQRIADSSPYAADFKIDDHRKDHELVHGLALDLTFTNPSGRFIATDKLTPADLKAHIDWLRQVAPQTDRWPSIAVVYDEAADIDWVRKQTTHLHADVVPRSAIEDRLKGLDYDHVILIVSSSTYRALFQRFSGSGRKRYESLRKLRIPLTRARDSVAVFGLPE